MGNIRSYRSPKIEVRNSELGGKGVFAKHKLLKDEVIAVKSGHILDKKQVREIAASVGDYALQIHEDIYLSPLTSGEVEETAIYINHSCSPNVGFDGQITYVAMRDIEAGEELCHDYSMERTDDYRLKCLCQSRHCRKTITGEDWKRSELQERYGRYFSSYILKRINTR